MFTDEANLNLLNNNIKDNAETINKFGINKYLYEKFYIEEADIQDILSNCNYSKSFIKTANDLQILDAISGCYEEYKVLNRQK